MGKTVTLGGERLGAGKKMKVHLHGYERSTHDLGYLWRSTMSAGTLVPFMSEVGLPADTFDINLECDIKTHPTVGPLFGSYKVQLDVFLAPIRLYNSQLHNNMLGIGMNMSQIKLPQIELTAIPTPAPANREGLDWDNMQINPSCILSYFGIRGVGTASFTVSRQFNAIPILAYWEIYKNYYANKMEEQGAVIHTPAVPIIAVDTIGVLNQITAVEDTVDPYPAIGGAPVNLNAASLIKLYMVPAVEPIPSQVMIQTQNNGVRSIDELTSGNWSWDVGTGILFGTYDYAKWGGDWLDWWRMRLPQELGQGKPDVVLFPLENIDIMRNNILAYQNLATPYVIDETVIYPYNWLADMPNGIPNMLSSQEGLGLKTYQSDLFNNWLQTEWIDGAGGITEVTSIDTSGGSFSIDTLNLSKKVYDMLNRIAVSGGSYDDWLDAVYDHDSIRRAESPMYMGGLIKELVFQEVVSNSDSGEQPLGTLAGKGVLSKKHKGGHIVIKVDEPSWIIGIISLTPRVDYSQGNKWDVHLKTIDDLHKPALDEIGFQELITEQMAWWDTHHDLTEWVQRSAGKQPAWINYMTNVNQTRGNFAIANNEMFMTLNRRYEIDTDTPDNGIVDLTTYIDPSKFNFIFAQTALDAQNFWAQIAVDITARRKMSNKIMPNL